MAGFMASYFLDQCKNNECKRSTTGSRDGKHDGKIRKVIYAIGNDGKYTGVNSEGWEPENFAMKQAWDDIDEQLEQTEKKVRAGELSPVAYFMQKNLMDIALLSDTPVSGNGR